jgi:hypothetical protein
VICRAGAWTSPTANAKISVAPKCFVAMIFVAVAALAGCADDFEARIHAEFRANIKNDIGRHVDGKIREVVLVPAEHLEWPKVSGSRLVGTTFARATLDDGSCYLVGPALALTIGPGQTLRGTVSGEIIDDWPVEILSLKKPCFPLNPASTIEMLDQ